ncbi:hypothetical protein JTE90_001886 [Oedothorax gibbosus]|uniref:Uncharacterized protein n=1 Tax=Oedothorax gibbosus TaxID=931172 RepID=A0AAV6VN06_9ARAC|nr:hypothetical protein JTE90_001886 [Oedothorax gibbosus]
MGLYLLLAFLVASDAVLGSDICPSPASISPCTCDDEGVNCMGDRSLAQIKNAFQANFKYGAVRSIWIQGTSLTSIPSDLFGKIKAQQFHLEMNQISSLDMRAFSASNKTINSLSFFGNKLNTFDFEATNKFEKLGTLNLGRNLLESIPGGALNSWSLNTLILSENKISNIGMNTFSNLPGLMRLELSFNSLTTLGPMSFAMKSHSAGLQINLSTNQISEVSASAFTGTSPLVLFLAQNQLKELKVDAFGNLITRIAQKGGGILLNGNPLTCRGCDYNWLVLNKQALFNHLPGFQCTDGRNLLSLTKANIGC